MEYGIGLSAASQEQYHDEHNASRYTHFSPPASVTIIKNMPLTTRWIEMASREESHF